MFKTCGMFNSMCRNSGLACGIESICLRGKRACGGYDSYDGSGDGGCGGVVVVVVVVSRCGNDNHKRGDLGFKSDQRVCARVCTSPHRIS